MCLNNLSILANSFQGLKIIMIQNLRGNPHISILVAFVFGLLFWTWEKIDLTKFSMMTFCHYFSILFMKRTHLSESPKILPFFFTKHKQLFISLEGFSNLEKRTSWYIIRGNAAHPAGRDCPLQIVMSVWCSFCLNSSFLGLGPSADNGAPKGHYYLQRAVTPDIITQQTSLQRAEAP